VPLTPSWGEGWTPNLLFEPDFFSWQLKQDGTVQERLMNGDVSFTDLPEMSLMLDRIIDVIPGYGPDPFMLDHGGSMRAFAMEEYPMLILGNWGIGEISSINPNGDFGFFASPMRNPGKIFQGGIDDGIMVSSNSKYPEQALDFLKFLVTPEANAIYNNKTMNVPAIQGVTLDNPSPMALDLKKLVEDGILFVPESVPNDIYHSDWMGEMNSNLYDFAVRAIEGNRMSNQEWLEHMDNVFATLRAMS